MEVQFSNMVDMPVVATTGHGGQFLNKVTMPVVATTGAFGAADANPAVVDVPVITQRRGVCRHPCRGADADSLGLPWRFSSCSTLTR